ncbi:BAG family molecular chaperone regulator 7-like [Morus notabilis]|uniref:BAG family molecular chaperone regulator 7-like n=1 Tax=Morus notabilis TaxID=981085 RepID=UPI000CED52D6|nr:BAG family molecular chaperone regulator 7-like [Morus notabilis]
MSRIRRIELIKPYTYTYYPSSSSILLRETSVFAPKTLAFPSFFDELEDCELGFGLGLDLVSPSLSPFELFDNVTDLIRVEKTPSFSSYRRIQRVERLGAEVFLERLSDRVSELESRFDRLARIGAAGAEDRKYTWTAEIKAPAAKYVTDRKYKLTAEIRDGKKEKKEQGSGKTYRWTAEIEGKGSDGPISRTYTFKASTGGGNECSESKTKEKKKKSDKSENGRRVVVIEEPDEADHGAVVLRQVIASKITFLALFYVA